MKFPEYTATETLRLLRDLFPKRKSLNLSLLTHYKTLGLVEPKGTLITSGVRKGRRHYTLKNIIELSCILKCRDAGIHGKLMKEIMK